MPAHAESAARSFCRGPQIGRLGELETGPVQVAGPQPLAAAVPTVYETVSGTFGARGSTWTATPQQAQHPCPTTTRPETPTCSGRPRPCRARRERPREPGGERVHGACCGVKKSGVRWIEPGQSVTRVSRPVSGLCTPSNGVVPDPDGTPGLAVHASTLWRWTPASTHQHGRAGDRSEDRDGERHRYSAGDDRAACLVERRARRASGPCPTLAPAPARGRSTPATPATPAPATRAKTRSRDGERASGDSSCGDRADHRATRACGSARSCGRGRAAGLVVVGQDHLRCRQPRRETRAPDPRAAFVRDA
jgi:hypothetical protein